MIIMLLIISNHPQVFITDKCGRCAPTLDGALGSDNECEDQAQNCQSFSQGEAQQRDGLQLRLGFWLACHTGDVCSENQTHTNGGANRGRPYTSMFQEPSSSMVFLSRC